MSSYDSMKNKLTAMGLYRITPDTAVYAELKAYAAGLDVLFGILEEMKSEYFIDTAKSYGIVNRERFTGAVRDDLSVEKRREMLKTRELTNENTCSPEAFKKITAGYGLSDFTITENPQQMAVTVKISDTLTDDGKRWIENMISNDFPVHLNVSVVYG